MPVYIVTGKLGAGKTLAMVGRMRDYIERGRPVATNVDLDLARLVKAPPRAPVYRLPDRPRREDLEALGPCHESGDEKQNGALVLDEAGTWLNSRAWSDKGRAELIDWFLHSRKLGWDVYIIVQALTLLDKQIRDAICEYLVICKRLDRMRVPVLGRLVKAVTGGLLEGRMPAVHIASVRYGVGHESLPADTWVYRGRELYGAYSTTQVVAGDAGALACYWHPGEPRPARPRPKLRAVELASAQERDEAWRLARRFCASLDRRKLGQAPT